MKKEKRQLKVLEPASGAELQKIKRMKELAHSLLECLVLEESGVRDGDGCWHGCDPIHEIIFELGGMEDNHRVEWAKQLNQFTPDDM